MFYKTIKITFAKIDGGEWTIHRVFSYRPLLLVTYGICSVKKTRIIRKRVCTDWSITLGHECSLHLDNRDNEIGISNQEELLCRVNGGTATVEDHTSHSSYAVE